MSVKESSQASQGLHALISLAVVAVGNMKEMEMI